MKRFIPILVAFPLLAGQMTIKDLSFFVTKQSGKTVVLPDGIDDNMTVFFGDRNIDYKKILTTFSKSRGYAIKEDQNMIIFDRGEFNQYQISNQSTSSQGQMVSMPLLPPPPLNTGQGSFNITHGDQIIRSVPFGAPQQQVDTNCSYSSKQLHFVEKKDVETLLEFSTLNFKMLPESSTIVFCTSQRDKLRLKSLMALIDEVDKPNDQVAVRITVSEIDQTLLRDVGITPKLTFDFSMLSQSGSLFSGNAVAAFYGSLAFLQNNGVSKISNSTEYFLTNGKKFDFADATTMPFRDENYIVTNQTVSNQSQRYKYKDVGYTLSINPKILGDQVQLDFDLKFENIISNLNDLPVTAGKKISTTFSAKKGDLIVLAGIKKANNLNSIDKMPIEIPFLSSIFQRKKDNNSDITLSISIEILGGKK